MLIFEPVDRILIRTHDCLKNNCFYQIKEIIAYLQDKDVKKKKNWDTVQPHTK